MSIQNNHVIFFTVGVMSGIFLYNPIKNLTNSIANKKRKEQVEKTKQNRKRLNKQFKQQQRQKRESMNLRQNEDIINGWYHVDNKSFNSNSRIIQR